MTKQELLLAFYVLLCGVCGCVHSILLYDSSRSVAVYRQWNITTAGQLEMKFKTNCKVCLVMYVDSNALSSQHKKNENSSYLEILLANGELQITQQIREHRENLLIGYNLNDLQWHKLRIVKYGLGTLEIYVDGKSHIINVSNKIARNFHIRSRLYIGGLTDDKKKSLVGISKSRPSFLGCIEGLKYSSGSLEMKVANRFIRNEMVSTVCENLCKPDTCQNGGICINYFTQTVCDCSSTGYDGTRCSIRTSETIHMKNSSFVKWTVKGATTSLQFRFKTVRENGIVFYEKRNENIFAVELVEGRVRVVAGYIKDKPEEVYLGRNIADGRWHSMSIVKTTEKMTVSLDRTFSETLTPREKNETNDEESHIFHFGGVEFPKFTYGLKAGGNFDGCLQKIYYNKNNVIHRMPRTNQMEKIGEVNRGCPYIQLSTRKPVTSTTILAPEKVTMIKEIHTREGGLGQNVIIWITAAIVIGTIIILISAACVVHHIKLRYYQNETKKQNEEDSVPMYEVTKSTESTEKIKESSRPQTPTMVKEHPLDKNEDYAEKVSLVEHMGSNNKSESDNKI